MTGLSSPHKKTGKTIPADSRQWAADAFAALEKAVIAFEEDYPDPNLDERLEIIGYAAEIAVRTRGIRDDEKIEAADEYAVSNALADLEAEEAGNTEPAYAILFLLCYLDVHVFFGLLKEEHIEPVIQVLIDEYDLAIR